MARRALTRVFAVIFTLNIIFSIDSNNAKPVDIDPSLYQGSANENDTALIIKIFETIENEIYPLTHEQVTKGDRVFGGAVFLNSFEENYPLIVIGTNRAYTKNALWHGEVSTMENYHNVWTQNDTINNFIDFSFNKEYNGDEPEIQNTIFLATHEPCSYCLSAITWNGFKNFYYLFTYEETENDFEMPGDIAMLQQVFNNFGSEEDPYYNEQNSFWTSRYIPHMIQEIDNPSVREILMDKYLEIKAKYKTLMDIHPDAGKEIIHHHHGSKNVTAGKVRGSIMNVEKMKPPSTHFDDHKHDNTLLLIQKLNVVIVMAAVMICCIVTYICCKKIINKYYIKKDNIIYK